MGKESTHKKNRKLMCKMELQDINSKIGSMINKCPSCRFKNITYSVFCDSCGFSWERYYQQELLKSFSQKQEVGWVE